MIYFRFLAKIVGIKAAFLYGDFKEEMYMEFPQEMNNVGEDDCIVLDKCIYGLVQDTMQFKKARFSGGNVDPCLYMKKSANCVVFVTHYLDENLMVVSPEAIDEAIDALQKHGLCLQVMEGLQDYLPCKEKFSDKKRVWLRQPHLITRLEKKFGDQDKSCKIIKSQIL